MVVAALAYVATRRAGGAVDRRRRSALKAQTAPAPPPARAEPPLGPPDPLELDLEELFDIQARDALTAQPHERVPAAANADDAEAPSADDLGKSWLSHATQSEFSARPADLVPDLENIADPNGLDESDEMEEPDEKEEEAQEFEPIAERETLPGHTFA
jgi:hypothetical protein